MKIRDNILFVIIFGMWVYMMYRLMNHTYSPICLYTNEYSDKLFFSIYIVLLFLYMCTKRLFTMTRFKLKWFYGLNEHLEYRPIASNGFIKKVYVKSTKDLFWYELDYPLCIDKGNSIDIYNKFINNNVTSGSLLYNMDNVYLNPSGKAEYEYIVSQYNIRLFFSFLLLSFILLYLWVL